MVQATPQAGCEEFTPVDPAAYEPSSCFPPSELHTSPRNQCKPKSPPSVRKVHRRHSDTMPACELGKAGLKSQPVPGRACEPEGHNQFLAQPGALGSESWHCPSQGQCHSTLFPATHVLRLRTTPSVLRKVPNAGLHTRAAPHNKGVPLDGSGGGRGPPSQP